MVATTIDRANQAVRRLPWLAAMGPIFAGIFFFALWLRFDGEAGPAPLELFLSSVLVIIAAKVVTFGWFGIHHPCQRYINFYDLFVLFQATVCSSILAAAADYLLFPALKIPRSVYLIDWGATVVVIGGLRSLMRLLQERGARFFLPGDQVPALIVGANEAGEVLLRAINRHRKRLYHVVGFIEEGDSRHNRNKRIEGVPILGTLDETRALAKRHNVREVLIIAGELAGRQVRQLVDECRRDSILVKVLPSYEALINGNLAVQPRPVSIEDLLQREPVQLDLAGIGHWIDDKTLLITGCAGSIGSEICRQLLAFSPRRLVLVDRSENGLFWMERELRRLNPRIEIEVCVADLADEARMASLFLRHRPEIVFHAAAYKHVHLMESQPGEAIKNIVLATRRLADLANRFRVQSFVMISTDKAVNPTSVMGASKRVAELYVQALSESSTCQFVTVRFGNVLDSAGSVVPIFREQIARGEAITVTDPRIERFFMTIPEASQLVIQAGAMGRGGEVFVLDMGDPVRIVDLAKDMIRLSGLQVGKDIEIEFIGLRPGEKLFEELHVMGEELLSTCHPKISVAQTKRHDLAAVESALERLRANTEQPSEVIIAELQLAVPEYQRTGLDPDSIPDEFLEPHEQRVA